MAAGSLPTACVRRTMRQLRWMPCSPPIAIVHTNDAHCAVDNNLGCTKLVNYVGAMRSAYGFCNVTLVDAGDAVQGKAMSTLTDGEYPH